MKVKDLSQPLFSGRMGNLIYYVRNGVQCVQRAEVPGKNGTQPVQFDELPVFQRRGEACGFRQFYLYEGKPAFAREDRSAYPDCQYFRIRAIPSHP